MSAPTRLLTYDDLLALPDDVHRYELIDGVLVVPPAPSWMHADIVAELLGLLRAFVRRHQPGGRVLAAPVDVRLSDYRVVQPDILYVRPGRERLFGRPPAVDGAPDLVIEVLSPSNSAEDQVDKFRIYEQAGIAEYWIVNRLAKTITIFVLRDDRYGEHARVDGLAASVVLPGFAVDVAEFFATVA